MTVGVGSAVGGLMGKIATTGANLQVWGLYHLENQVVSAFVNGQDCGDYTVALDGSVTIIVNGNTGIATTGKGNTITSAYLLASGGAGWGEMATPLAITTAGGTTDVLCALAIGLPYYTQGQRMRPASGSDVQSPSGPALGKTRRSHMFAALLLNTVQVEFGTALDPSGNMLPAAFSAYEGMASDATGTMYSGVYFNTLVDNYSFDSALCWQVSRPYPCTIVACTQFLHTTER